MNANDACCLFGYLVKHLDFLPLDEPMDVSKTENSQSQRGRNPNGSGPVPKPRPTSTPVSQNSPGFVLDKSLPLPSQPEFSYVSV